MSLLSRYLLRVFLGAFALSLVTMILLSFLIDFASRATAFFSLQGRSWIWFLVEYYGVRIPMFALFSVPTVTLLAAMISFVRLARRNEILPIVTSGRSFRRIALPLFVFAFLAGTGTAALEEFLLPDLTRPMGETNAVLKGKEEEAMVTLYGPDGDYLEAVRYHRIERRLEGVRITKIGPSGRRESMLYAREGVWDEARKGWVFTGGSVVPFDERGFPLHRVDETGERILRHDPLPPLFRGGLLPREIVKGSRHIGDFWCLAELREKIERFPDIPAFRIRFHSRLAFPLSPVVLLLLGLPFVAPTARHGFVRGGLACFGVVAAFYVVHFVLVELGGLGRIPHFMAAWGAIGLFGGAGLVSFFRLKT